jgi:hypothetical protein
MKLFVTLLLFGLSTNAVYCQPEIWSLKYFENTKELELENGEIAFITYKDTVTLNLLKGQFTPAKIDTTFQIIIKIDDKTFQSENCKPHNLEMFNELIIGTISETDKFIKRGLGYEYEISKEYSVTLNAQPETRYKIKYLILSQARKIGTVRSRSNYQSVYYFND